MNILITGGAGFIGSNLADKLLLDNHNIIVIDNFDNYYDKKLKKENIKLNLNNPNYKLYKCDIYNKEKLNKVFSNNKIDIVIHLAAKAGVRSSLENPIDYVETNILGTINILECMHKYNIPKLIFASSSSVYGNCKKKKFSENFKINKPISPYAATKLACEQIIYTYYYLYNIKAICLRFFTVYGPRQRPDLAIRKFIEKIENNISIDMYGDGTTKRDYTYIDDIISGICSSINYDKTGYEIINLGGGKPIMLKDMIKTIEKVFNKKAIINQKSMQPGDVDKTICDYTKANKLLGYVPKTTFKQGIQKFKEWKNNIRPKK